jgi:hypothetical protein
MLADPLREALCEHQEESAIIDTPLQKGARGWSLTPDAFWILGERMLKQLFGSKFRVLVSIQNFPLVSWIVFCWFCVFVACMSAVEVMDLVKPETGD